MIDSLIIATAVAQMVSLYYINIHQRPIYPLILFVYSGYLILEIWLVFTMGWTILLFCGINIFSIVTAIKGWNRS